MEYKGEELELFGLMNKALKDHNKRTIRMKYYPHNMDEWETEHKAIERNYRELIDIVRQERLTKEYDQDVKDAAEALLMLKESTEKMVVAKKKRTEKKASVKEVATNIVPRKSARLANKKK